jgi:hypothetical protein
VVSHIVFVEYFLTDEAAAADKCVTLCVVGSGRSHERSMVTIDKEKYAKLQYKIKNKTKLLPLVCYTMPHKISRRCKICQK